MFSLLKNYGNKKKPVSRIWITLLDNKTRWTARGSEKKKRKGAEKSRGGHAWGLMQHLTNVTDWRRQDNNRTSWHSSVHVLTCSICVCVSVWVCGCVSRLLPFFFTLSNNFFTFLSQFSCSVNLCILFFFLFLIFANVVIIYSKCWGRKRQHGKGAWQGRGGTWRFSYC